MRSSKSISLWILGSALAVVGCGGQQAGAPCPVGPDGKPVPGPDGKINPNCTKSNSRSHVRTGGFFFMGGGSTPSTTSVKPGVTTTTTPSGTKSSFGGFGGTGRSVGGGSTSS